ncbi:MAG: DUF4280 domain-containing protein [Oscillospiraceae bacterium]|jgi:hypothetical protein
MSQSVVTGAVAMCTCGLSPGTLIGTSKVFMGGAPCLTIRDAAPLQNIGSFGMCTTQSNPAVAAATAAALGVPTPAPCVPAPAGIWQCAGAPMVGGAPALTSEGTITCAYGGSISIRDPGQRKVGYK